MLAARRPRHWHFDAPDGQHREEPAHLDSPTVAAAITGPLATCVFGLQMNGPAVASGMGTCGLVGQIGVYTGWVNDVAAGLKPGLTAFDWAGSCSSASCCLPCLRGRPVFCSGASAGSSRAISNSICRRANLSRAPHVRRTTVPSEPGSRAMHSLCCARRECRAHWKLQADTATKVNDRSRYGIVEVTIR